MDNTKSPAEAELSQSDNSIPDKDRMQLLIPASVVLIVLSMLANFFLYRQWQKVKSDFVEAEMANVQFAHSFEEQAMKMELLNKDLSVLLEEGMNSLVLQAANGNAIYKAIVYHDKNSGAIFIHVKDLPETDTENQYQFWVKQEGVWVASGLFDVQNTMSDLLEMRSSLYPEAFAISKVSRGGGFPVDIDEMILKTEIGSNK